MGALVTGENEDETTFLLNELKRWLPSVVNFMTIDFSSRLEAGVNEVFPGVLLQKCVFHTVQLLIMGLKKEFTKIKKETILAHIKAYKVLSRYTISLENDKLSNDPPPFQFSDVDIAKKIHGKLRNCSLRDDPKQIEQ